MNKPANHIGYKHELNDELQIEKVHHVYLDKPQTYPNHVMRDALDAVFDPILSNFYSNWKWYGGSLHNALYL